MFYSETLRGKTHKREKWASTAGDHAVVSARDSRGSGKYLEDLNNEMSESIRFMPVKPSEKLTSVKPSCCANREELPELTGQIQLSTGKAEIGYDKKKKDIVFSFVRHENDSQGKEVLENKARSHSVYDSDLFRSNDEKFTEGAMELRCNVAKSPKKVLRQFGKMSGDEGGDTTLDRVIPFHRRNKELAKVQSLLDFKSSNYQDRTNIHSAISGTRVLAAKKQQKNMEFNKKLFKAVASAKENTHSEDYMIYIKKKWEMMRLQHSEEFPELEERLQTDFTPEEPVKDNSQVKNIE